MDVLYLTEERISFSGTMVRGGQIHVERVVRGLRERGHEVSLVDRNSDPERPFQYSVAPLLRFGVDPARVFVRAVSVGRYADVDVVVSKTRKTYLPGLAAARALGVPHVVHVGSSLDRPVAGPYDKVNAASFAARLRAPHDGYFVVCDHIGAQLRERGVDPDRVFDVKNAVDTDRFHPDTVPQPLDETVRRRLDERDGDRFRFGYVGGLQPYKGLDDLQAALDCLDADAEVVVAGDGPERDKLEGAFGDDAVFLGSVPYEQVPALYHEFDAFVLPSHTEGLPRVILEAQATATPVVATRVGGVPEVVTDGETGLLCPVQDVDGLAEAMGRLVEDDAERTRLGRQGREAVETAYSWDGMYDRYERFLSAVVERA